MAVTKILARHAPVKVLIDYALNGDKTDERILTASQRCTTEFPAYRMAQTKKRYHQENGVQCYHIIQSFQPREVTPEQALEIAQEFTSEHLGEYEAVIGVHVDRQHIHAHIVFNSVNAVTGKKYKSTPQTYYRQIRAISDRLCREHGLSVIMAGEGSQSKSYIEWLRESKGQPTFCSMLEADLLEAIEDANDLGHFFLIMEHKGYEIYHGNRLGFRLRGQERFMYPGRRDPRFTEEAIQSAIAHNMAEIEAGRRPAVVYRTPYRPVRHQYVRYKGIVALYYHYVRLLGLCQKRQLPPRMDAHMKREVMKFEKNKAQFAFLRDHDITAPEQLAAFSDSVIKEIAALEQQRMMVNVRKKPLLPLFSALADVEALEPAKRLYEQGVTGMEAEYLRWREAKELLDHCGVSRTALTEQKAEVYHVLAELNLDIKGKRRVLVMSQEIQSHHAQMEQEIRMLESRERHTNKEKRADR